LCRAPASFLRCTCVFHGPALCSGPFFFVNTKSAYNQPRPPRQHRLAPAGLTFSSTHRNNTGRQQHMWFKNLRIFRLSPSWSCTAESREAALQKQAFQPGSSRDMQSLGWIAPREDCGLVYGQNGQYLITLRADKKLLPTTVINQF